MTTEAAEKPLHMTDAEWEALHDDDLGPNPDDGIVDADDDEPAPADADVTPPPAADDTPPPADAEEPAPAPLLVANAPEDATARLAELATQKEELATKFDDGEMSAKEYQTQLDALAKEERKIELDLHKAQIAAEMQAQQARNTFLREVQEFTAGTIYKESALAWNTLDAAVRAVGSDPANAALTGRQILEKAHAEVLKDPVLAAAFGTRQPKPEKAEAKKPAPTIPPTLGRVPAAETEDTSGNRFAALERLLETDPIAYEKAVGKLSPAELDAFLSR